MQEARRPLAPGLFAESGGLAIDRRPLIPLLRIPGRLAQLGERRLDKAEVTGSSPVSPIVDIGSRAEKSRLEARGLVAIW
jgi:hypothetical protein